eukprot:306858-Hanusia_phi.AAC.2
MQIKSMLLSHCFLLCAHQWTVCHGLMVYYLKEVSQSISVVDRDILGLCVSACEVLELTKFKVLATLRSDATVYIVEKKETHCEIAQKRSDVMGLKNVRIRNVEVSEFHDAFDLGLGLHACESLASMPALGGYFFVRGRDTDPKRMLKANLPVDCVEDMDESDDGKSQEERVAAAKAREDAVVRARVYLQAKEQEQREVIYLPLNVLETGRKQMKAPMQTSVKLLDEILEDVALPLRSCMIHKLLIGRPGDRIAKIFLKQ